MSDRKFLFDPVTTIDEGKAWIAKLIAGDCLFHFEDDPREIFATKSDEPFFTPEEAEAVALRVEALYSFGNLWAEHECPIGYALDLTDPDWRTKV